jgi:phosphatidylglycerophosphate synthase
LNLPNTVTVTRILCTPFIATLPLIPSWKGRLGAFVLYVVVAVTDYLDGMLARTRNSVTDLGRLLDPLADKLLLFATLIPMYVLMAPPHPGLLGEQFRGVFKFITPWGEVGLPLWVVVIVIGREVFMTIFRQLAAKRGVVISAIRVAKWKTGFQWTWVGSAFFWFFAATAAAEYDWTQATLWIWFANFNGLFGVVTMLVAVFLTLYSLWIYLRRYGSIFTG